MGQTNDPAYVGVGVYHPDFKKPFGESPAPVVADQPPPVPSDRPAIWDLVVADMQARDKVGRERYGTPLQAHNGRDALVDGYQEVLDLAVYLRQEIEERQQHKALLLLARDALQRLVAGKSDAWLIGEAGFDEPQIKQTRVLLDEIMKVVAP